MAAGRVPFLRDTGRLLWQHEASGCEAELANSPLLQLAGNLCLVAWSRYFPL